MHVLRIRTHEQVRALSSRLLATVDEGRELRVTVEDWKNTRSLDQNRRYWAILTDLARAAPSHMDGVWYAPEVWHEHFKRKFLGVQEGPFGPVPKTTTKLSTLDFSGYCDQIEAWAAEEGIILEAA